MASSPGTPQLTLLGGSVWGELLVRDTPVVSPSLGPGWCPVAPGARGRRALPDPRGQPGCSVVAPPAGASRAGWISALGEQPRPNPGARSRDPPQDPALPRTCPTCPLPRGSPGTPCRARQVWAQTLSFGPRHVPSRGPPVTRPLGWERAEPQIRGASSFLAVFFPGSEASEQAGEESSSRVAWTRGRARSCPAPGAVTQPGSSREPAHRAAPDPRVPPCPRWDGGASGLVALAVTPWWRQGQRRARCRSGAGLWRGGTLPGEVLGCRGAAGAPGLGRARQPCVTAAPQTRPT